MRDKFEKGDKSFGENIETVIEIKSGRDRKRDKERKKRKRWREREREGKGGRIREIATGC